MKIAFTADWHIRSKHLQRLHRGPDFTSAALSAVEEAVKAGAVAVLNGGDTFHDSRPTTSNIEDLMKVDRLLQEHGLWMYTIDGNHDRADPSWLDTLFDPAKNDRKGGIVGINNKTVCIQDGGESVRVIGIPSCGAAELIERLNELASEADRPEIVLWHGPLREMCGYPDPLAASIADLPTHAFKAILCGDIHKRQFTVTGDGCLVGYPGATELGGRDEYAVRRSITIVDTSTEPYSTEEVFIKHRPVHAFTVRSVEQLEEVVGKLQRLPKDPWPIVFVSYDAMVHPHVSERLYNALDNPLGILRASPMPKFELPSFSLRAEGVDHKEVADFVPKFFANPGSLQDLAVSLCAPGADHRDLIDRYAEEAVTL